MFLRNQRKLIAEKTSPRHGQPKRCVHLMSNSCHQSPQCSLLLASNQFHFSQMQFFRPPTHPFFQLCVEFSQTAVTSMPSQDSPGPLHHQVQLTSVAIHIEAFFIKNSQRENHIGTARMTGIHQTSMNRIFLPPYEEILSSSYGAFPWAFSLKNPNRNSWGTPIKSGFIRRSNIQNIGVAISIW